MNIVSSYPLWYYIFCIVLATILAFVLYRKDKKLIEFSKLTVGFLFFLRLVCISIVAAMLLSPLVKYLSKTIEKPIIIVAQDNSSSMLMGKDSSLIKTDLEQKLLNLKTELKENFEVHTFQFDEFLKQADVAPKYDGKLTNFDILFDELESRFANRNVGGLLLVSDGIYNQGNNPIYSAEQLEYPVFSVATGDTTSYIDVRLNNLRANKLAFLGNKFPIEFDVKSQEAIGEQVEVSISRNGTVVHSQLIQVEKANQVETIRVLLAANLVGKQKYTIYVKPLKGERNLLNNKLNFYIDVLDARQKIALLGVAPHPDLAAIKRSISKNENYQVESSLLKDFKQSFRDFDLVILHQAVAASDRPLDKKLQELMKTNLPILIVGGGWQSLELQFGIKNSNKNARVLKNESQAKVNQLFTLFTLEDKLKTQLERFPPLVVSSDRVKSGNTNSTLLFQKLGNVATSYSLLRFYEKDGRKIGRLYGEGFWKWSISDYIENKSHNTVNQFMSKVIQYLAVKADRSFFRLSSADEFFENDDIIFNAQLFNPSYELVNDSEVELKLVNEENEEFIYNFNRSLSAYQLNIPELSAGVYQYSASTSFQGKQYKETGVITVKELQLEQLESEANHNLMHQIAKRSGGELLSINDLNTLADVINNRSDITSVSYINEEVEDIINLKWIFFLILTLLSLEWFIRKRGGAY